MTRRTLAVALVVLGAIAVLAAIASATIWRPTDTATLSLPSRPEAPVVVSDAGVLDAVGPDVTIRATAGGDEPVVLAVGRTADVDAWVGTAAHTRITGLESWEQLKVDDVAAGGTEEPTEGATAEPAEPAALPNPAGSDLWVAEQTGTGSAELTWADRDGRWSLLAATDGTAPAPEVTLTWDVEVRTPWLVPGLILGGLLMIAGIALLVLQVLGARESGRRPAPVGAADDDETVVLPAAAGAGLTRRELRERERAEARRRGRGRTGEIPVVATTGEIPVTSARGLDDAGVARGAGIVPASARAEELRAAREPEAVTDAATAEHPLAPDDDTASAGVARGAGVVPASDRAAELRAGRDGVDEPSDTGAGAGAATGAAVGAAAAAPAAEGATAGSSRESARAAEEAAEWTEDETGDQATAAMPVVTSTEETAAMPVVTSTEETAAMPVVESTEETAAMPVVEPADETAAMPVVEPADENTPAEEPTITEEHEPDAQPEDRQGWRSLWGFGGRRRPTDEGEEQR
ncbi:hypothetical protein ATJ97_3249 [Georgenia soli]|uniref:Uncharacterized protein n=1 Tax=Georgenia soli TaxID=638953 RepID=A0A2A9EQ38_9MICO|nr:hypothetical protein [Georgenia soli]PFG40716.1 hypothetical protein ATJ97_3249 [Georgenia soli]